MRLDPSFNTARPLRNSGTIESLSGVISHSGAGDLANGTLQVGIRRLSSYERILFAPRCSEAS